MSAPAAAAGAGASKHGGESLRSAAVRDGSAGIPSTAPQAVISLPSGPPLISLLLIAFAFLAGFVVTCTRDAWAARR